MWSRHWRLQTMRLQQSYTVSYIAHVPLEPRAALAKWEGESLTVWTGTQRPFGVRGELAEAFHIPEDKVRVLMPDTGSAYGGKHTGEAAIEAARMAKAAKRPVKVTWSREEEFTWAYFRPAGVIEVTSGVQKDGTITAWEFHNYNSGSAGIKPYYEISNQRIVFHESNSPLRQGSYRALASTANHFARESHMDELANGLNMDPLQFRLKNLKNERLRDVFQAAAEKFGWGNRKAVAGQGFGMGGGYEKLGNIATFVEVNVDSKTGVVKVVRVISAFECGAIVNPDNLRSQVEGANVQGLGGALFEVIQFENGKILNPRLSQYRVPRFKDLPVDRDYIAGSQRLAVRRSRGMPDDRPRPGHRQCNLRRHKGSPAIPAVGTAGLEDVRLIAAVSTSYGMFAISRTILESLSL